MLWSTIKEAMEALEGAQLRVSPMPPRPLHAEGRPMTDEELMTKQEVELEEHREYRVKRWARQREQKARKPVLER